MTKEELEEQLRERGGKPGEWDDFGGAHEGTPKPKFIRDQVKNLHTLKAVLEQAVGSKEAEVDLLRERLVRLRYGGGS